MGMPTLSATSGTLVRDGIYIQALIKADPATADLADVLAHSQADLRAAMATRTEQDTAAIEAGAQADYWLGAVRRAMVVFATKAFGHFLSRKADGYVRLLPKAATALGGVPAAERVPTFDRLKKAALDKATPKELGPAAKELADTVDAWHAAIKVEGALDEQLAHALVTEKRVADAWHTSVRKLRGRLIDRFPRDARRVSSYFPRRVATPAKPKAAVEVGPEPKA